ncbi:MAG TPA: Rid family detoxifying hydrolase [Terriglobia bacterium]|nr:Rid family detoxifying hydrolase [Terriglobia bacterium]
MITQKIGGENSGRRKFLRRGLGAAATLAGAGAAALPAAAKSHPAKAEKKAIYPKDATPSKDAVFSPGIQLGNLLFVSGAGAHDPVTHKVVQGSFQDQVRRCLDNIKLVLDGAGSSPDKVLKCTVFLKDIKLWGEMNVVYHQFFPTDPPARSTIAVADLPGESPVEIECIAYV